MKWSRSDHKHFLNRIGTEKMRSILPKNPQQCVQIYLIMRITFGIPSDVVTAIIFGLVYIFFGREHQSQETRRQKKRRKKYNIYTPKTHAHRK